MPATTLWALFAVLVAGGVFLATRRRIGTTKAGLASGGAFMAVVAVGVMVLVITVNSMN